MMETFIEINNLRHRFPDGTLALQGINLKIGYDSLTLIGGKNGSGKTVLMKHLNGLLSPTEGSVSVGGIPVEKDSNNARKRIGFVFQNSSAQIIAQTVADDIAFGPENIGCPKDDVQRRVASAAEALGITDILYQSPHRLSGGEKKKVAVAGILAMEPEMIVFDEPFAGLDYSGVKMLLRKILEIRKNGTSVIVITHDLEKILAHADRFIILSDGMISGDGSPAGMLETAVKCGLRIPPETEIGSMTWLD